LPFTCLGRSGRTCFPCCTDSSARAKKFWSEVVGFEITTDVPYDYKGNRWVEVTTADGETVLVLSAVTS
jgi:hypothetical protein